MVFSRLTANTAEFGHAEIAVIAILITHDVHGVVTPADRGLVLRDGSFVLDRIIAQPARVHWKTRNWHISNARSSAPFETWHSWRSEEVSCSGQAGRATADFPCHLPIERRRLQARDFLVRPKELLDFINPLFDQ